MTNLEKAQLLLNQNKSVDEVARQLNKNSRVHTGTHYWRETLINWIEDGKVTA